MASPIDILIDATSATVTAGGTTGPPAALTTEQWTVTASGWPVAANSQTPAVPLLQYRVIDAVDLGKQGAAAGQPYEEMLVVGSANGTGITWNVIRGINGTTPKVHASNWVAVPAPTGMGVRNAIQAFQDSVELQGRAGAASVGIGPLLGTVRQQTIDGVIGDSIPAGIGASSGYSDMFTDLGTLENRQNALADHGVGFVSPNGGGVGRGWGDTTSGAIVADFTIASVTLSTTTTVTAASFPGVIPGQTVTVSSGTGTIPANTYVVSVSGGSLVLSAATTAGTATLNFSTPALMSTESSWKLTGVQAIGDGVTKAGASVTVAHVNLVAGSTAAQVVSGGFPGVSNAMLVTSPAQALGGITAVSGSGTQVTFTAANTLSAGDTVLLAFLGGGFGSLNGTVVTVLASGLSGSQFLITSALTGATTSGFFATGSLGAGNQVRAISGNALTLTQPASTGGVAVLTFVRAFRRAQVYYQKVNLGDNVTFAVVGGTAPSSGSLATAAAAGGIGVWDSGDTGFIAQGVTATCSAGGGAGVKILGVRYSNNPTVGVNIDNLAYPSQFASTIANTSMSGNGTGTIATGWAAYVQALALVGSPMRRLYIMCGTNDVALGATAAAVAASYATIATSLATVSPSTEPVFICEHYGDGVTGFANVTTVNGSPLISSPNFSIPFQSNPVTGSQFIASGISSGAVVTNVQGSAQTTVASITTNGTTTATVVSGGFPGVSIGMLVTGTNITASPPTYVNNIVGNTLTLSQNASGSGTQTLTFTTVVTLSLNATASATVPGTEIFSRLGPINWSIVRDTLKIQADNSGAAFIDLFAISGDLSPHAQVASVTTTINTNTMTVVSGGFPGVVKGQLPYLLAGGVFASGTVVTAVSGNTVTLSANALATATNTIQFLGDTAGVSSGGLHYGDATQSPSGRDGHQMVAEAIFQRLAFSHKLGQWGVIQTATDSDGKIVAALPTATSAAGNGVSWAGFAHAADTQPQWALLASFLLSPGLYVGPGGGTATDTSWTRSAAGVWSAGNTTTLGKGAIGLGAAQPSVVGTRATLPPTTATIQTALGNLTLGSALHNTLSYDVRLTVYLAITVNTSLVVQLGVGTTNTPVQTTIITGTTALGIVAIPFTIPAGQFAKLSTSGTATDAIVGQYFEAA